MMTQGAKKLTVVALGLAFLATMGPVLAAELGVQIRPQAQVESEQVRLADVAQISGPESTLKENLAQIRLASLPRAGQSVTLPRNRIASLLQASGLPLDQATWEVPEQVTVTRAAQELSPDWVRQVVEEYLAGVEPYQGRTWNLVGVRTGNLPPVPAGQLAWRVLPSAATNAARPAMTILVTVNDREVTRFRVTAEVDLMVRAVLAPRRLEKGHRLEAADLEETEISLSRLTSGALTEIKQAEGMTLRTSLQAGQVVSSRDLIRTRVVNKGDPVTILAQTGPLRVTCQGQARQSGSVGDRISVTNTNSNKTVMARVVGAGMVEVIF